MSCSTKSVLVALAALLLASVPARAWAEGESVPQGGSMAVASVPAEEKTPGMKSGTTALLLSLLGTAVPVAASAPYTSEDNGAAVGVFLGTLILGPSLGHFYAGHPGHAFAGIGIRTASMLAVGFGLAISWNHDSAGAGGLAVLGLVVGGGSAVWDIVRAPHAAQEHNESLRKAQHNVSILPSLSPRSVGLSVSVSF